jgi:hypothetical protein
MSEVYFETRRGKRIPATITRRWKWTLHAIAHHREQDTREKVTLRLNGLWMSEGGWVLRGDSEADTWMRRSHGWRI